MKLQFKTQAYQSEATKAITDLFIGQKKALREDIVDRKIVKDGLLEEEIVTKRFSNQEISQNIDILKNIQNVQKKDPLLKQSLDLKAGLNFTIEMETGTGKTYVYTKSCFELNRLYGWSKFIIVVPSIAIREGVYKSLEITKEHFKEMYNKTIRYFIYDTKNSSNLTNISSFSNSSNIEIMIVNYQAFATSSKESRKIYEKQDSMQSLRPIDVLNRTRPILIIDEPQRLGKTAEKKLEEFKSLFTLRFSATHKNDFHKIYRLDAIDAYNQKLVKKISVKAINVQGDSATGGYVFFDRIILSKNNPEALIEIDIKQKNSIVKKSKKVKEGDNLYDLSQNLAQYQDSYIVSSIDARTNTIRFLNGIILQAGEAVGSLEEKHLRRIQIRETIRSHIQKEKILFKKGIKVLSLFFIDEVAKYRIYDENNNQIKSEYEKIFEEEYKKAIEESRSLFDEEYFKYLDKFNVSTIHKGYFSIDKKGKALTKESDIQNDVSAYDLIMKDKERLLDFAEATRFIFSHSALKEGWDNPNVFQICTLKHSNSTDSKRQEIGRGLRLCVNKQGIRQDFEALESEFFDTNNLTVIASESYDEFAKTLQKEILESLSRETKIDIKTFEKITLKNEKGEVLKISKTLAKELFEDWKSKEYIGDDGFITQKAIKDFKNDEFKTPLSFIGFEKELKEIVKQASSSAIVKDMIDNDKSNNEIILKPNENFHKKEFQALWQKINSKASYTINIDSEDLIKNSIESINQSLEVQNVKVQIISSSQKEDLKIDDLSKANSIMEEAQNFYEKMDYELGFTKYDLIGEIVKNSQITRKTAIKILSEIRENKFAMFKSNPEDFILKITKIINTQKVKLIISGIKYHKTHEVYDTDIFTIQNFKFNLSNDTGDTIEVKRHIYDYLKADSKVEKNLAKAMDNSQVVVYAKLPNDFKIPTPLGGYNPDWAVVFENEDQKNIYFIAETKGSCDESQLKGSEDLKIAYAKKYFEYLKDENITYDCVEDYGKLLDKIFQTQIQEYK